MTSAASTIRRAAFTLVELLVVLVIIAVLAALLFPALQAAIDEGRKTACLSNLRQIGAGVAAWAADHDGEIPYGPNAPAFTSPADLYPSTGAPTSLLSLRKGKPVALGLLLDTYLAKTPKVLFCPGCDQPQDADTELSRVGKSQAQGSYYYRHGGNTQLFDDPYAPFTPSLKLNNLGDNRNGVPIRALVIDTMFLCPPGLDAFGVKPRTYHRQKYVNILFTDGHATSRSNTDGKYTVDVSDPMELTGSFDKILKVFEYADEHP
jgi:prepilin-type N-terminal cleavage/methylation domain-containing protein/prepilin-type processing-associated H-X9-DG protein